MPNWCHTCEHQPARSTGPLINWVERHARQRLYCTPCASWYQQHETTP